MLLTAFISNVYLYSHRNYSYFIYTHRKSTYILIYCVLPIHINVCYLMFNSFSHSLSFFLIFLAIDKLISIEIQNNGPQKNFSKRKKHEGGKESK